jgi:hypothetical protein
MQATLPGQSRLLWCGYSKVQVIHTPFSQASSVCVFPVIWETKFIPIQNNSWSLPVPFCCNFLGIYIVLRCTTVCACDYVEALLMWSDKCDGFSYCRRQRQGLSGGLLIVQMLVRSYELCSQEVSAAGLNLVVIQCSVVLPLELSLCPWKEICKAWKQRVARTEYRSLWSPAPVREKLCPSRPRQDNCNSSRRE